MKLSRRLFVRVFFDGNSKAGSVWCRPSIHEAHSAHYRRGSSFLNFLVTKQLQNNYLRFLSVPQYPDYEDSVGYAYRGVFFALSPWPVFSLSKAEKYMADLNSHSPNSRRNRYYQAVIAFRLGKYQEVQLSLKKDSFICPKLTQ